MAINLLVIFSISCPKLLHPIFSKPCSFFTFKNFEGEKLLYSWPLLSSFLLPSNRSLHVINPFTSFSYLFNRFVMFSLYQHLSIIHNHSFDPLSPRPILIFQHASQDLESSPFHGNLILTMLWLSPTVDPPHLSNSSPTTSKHWQSWAVLHRARPELWWLSWELAKCKGTITINK